MSVTEKLSSLPIIESGASPETIFDIGRDVERGRVVLACSFSVEDVVLIDNLKNRLDQLTIFAIDTGRLNEETYEAAESITMRYGINIDWYFPLHYKVEMLEKTKGLFSFRESLENRKECCYIRKVEPLQRALKGCSAWITGMRREQCPTRAGLEAVEKDMTNGGLLKLNPLALWSEKEVWDYAEQHKLPINRLHQQGYLSIGCAPCTRAIKPGEDARAGRWWWENPENKECGLHRR